MARFTFDQLKQSVNAGRIDTVLVCLVDMYGRLIGKRFHAQHFVESGYEETHGCDYLLANDIDMEPVPGYAASSWEKGYGDFIMQPDLSTLYPIPWLDGTALVLCDVLDHHHPLPPENSRTTSQTAEMGQKLPHYAPLAHSPRAILKQQIARLAERDITAYFASELEFYLFDESYRSAREKGYTNLQTAGYYIEDYHIFQTSKEEPVMRAIRNGLYEAGIPVENSKGEWGPGQEEINVRYADALTMADRHVILKNGIKEIAHQQDKAITFMAKWHYELAGSSCHIHSSLWDKNGDQPLFVDQKNQFGMSKLMQQYMAGQHKYAADITYFLAPFINSYKRFQAGTFAPTKAVWSRDNRTAGFRLCGEGTNAIRTECRIGGADLNPHLAFAALIAAGLAGIEEGLALEPPYVGDAYQDADLVDVPRTLRAATEALDQSAMLRAALGDNVIEHYVHTAKWEQFEYDRRVTDWERQRGFEKV